jgi:pimeloyl-ACP methyl ester carboxylesterase
MPGFIGGDLTTGFLRRFLDRLGYRSHGWGLGMNLGPGTEVVRGLVDRLRSIVDRSGRKVTLVGWSLGGVYGYELARRYSENVRALITLASPLRNGPAHLVASSFDEILGPAEVEHGPARAAPPTVPTTSLFSRTDAIVPSALWVVGDRLAQREGEWRPFDPDGATARLLRVRRGPTA